MWTWTVNRWIRHPIICGTAYELQQSCCERGRLCPSRSASSLAKWVTGLFGALGHEWHSTCFSSSNTGDNKTGFWKALQKTLSPIDQLSSDWVQYSHFIEKVWIRWGYSPIQPGLMPGHPFDSSEAWGAAWWRICSLNSQGLQLLQGLVIPCHNMFKNCQKYQADSKQNSSSSLLLFQVV